MKYPEGEVCHTVEEPLAFTLFLCYSRKADFPLKKAESANIWCVRDLPHLKQNLQTYIIDGVYLVLFPCICA